MGMWTLDVPSGFTWPPEPAGPVRVSRASPAKNSLRTVSAGRSSAATGVAGRPGVSTVAHMEDVLPVRPPMTRGGNLTSLLRPKCWLTPVPPLPAPAGETGAAVDYEYRRVGHSSTNLFLTCEPILGASVQVTERRKMQDFARRSRLVDEAYPEVPVVRVAWTMN